MATSDTELEEQLLQAGNRLVDPPSSVDELLPLLDRVENCLSRVEQSPTKSMQSALSPSLKALVADKLFRHSDIDVKVAVASCISEITRITAPDAPYDDDQMKEIFQLIVSSFENLSDNTGRSYTKRTSILETVAKVRSCVVMLDLECDALILEMFQNFLKEIRDYHPENVISSMETIMTLVIEESEDISPELLTPILATVKKDNEEVLPLARKLAEKVLESCATKLKPYLIQTVKTLGISLDDYSKVVASICQETSGATEQNEVHTAGKDTADESKSVGASLDEADQEDKESARAVISSEQDNTATQKSPNMVVSNGVAQTGKDDSLLHSNSQKKLENDHQTDQSKSINTSSSVGPDSLVTEKAANTEDKPEESNRKKGRRSTSAKSTEPSDSSLIDDEVETEKLPEHKSHSKDVASSPVEGPSVEAAGSTENEKETIIKLSSPKALENESGNVASQSPSGSLLDESHPKKAGGRQKKKESLNKEATQSVDDVSKKASEGTSDSELKSNRRSGKKLPGDVSNENKTQTAVDASKKESASVNYSEGKSAKQSAKKVDGGGKNGDGSASKQPEDKKRRGRGKAVSEKDITKSSAKDDEKEMLTSAKSATKSNKDDRNLEETPKTNSKRKRIPDNEKDSNYGENLVGSKVKVWWPKDRMFYEGVIDSFDSVKKKHKVLYTDGDEEILNLKKERWDFIGGDSESDEDEATERQSLETSSKTPSKKKVKMISDEPTKHGKTDASPRKGGGASSSKSKVSSSKSDRKSRDGKPKEDTLRTLSKSEDASSGKSKDHAPKGGSSKSVDATPKLAGKSKNIDTDVPKTGKSKDDDTSTPRTSTKSKQDTAKTGKSRQETPKSASISKGKTLKSGGKSSANGTGKVKSGAPSKTKESDDVKENSSDSTKVPESTKGKSPNSSKVMGSDSKSGKKRRRGAKS